MQTLEESLSDPTRFLCGVELVSTRGAISGDRARLTRAFAEEVSHTPGVDWISITDNAGGNPMLSPVALGKPLLYAGKEVLIHLSCKDFNRGGLESAAWQLASEGFHNILTLSGDYPALKGFRGQAKPVFDIDSVGLLTMLSEMNGGLRVAPSDDAKRLGKTSFFLGAVATNFKLRENEVMPQYFKLEKKISAGARFVIAQIGYDSRKNHEMKAYLERVGHGALPLVGNVYLLNLRVARFFNSGKMPGVVVASSLLEQCEKYGKGADKGKKFFVELAAKQLNIFKGLGFRGGYVGGVDHSSEVEEILSVERSFGAGDWKGFAREIRFSRPGEFFYFAEDSQTGLSDARRLSDDYTRRGRRPKGYFTGYKFNQWVHTLAFTPGKGLFGVLKKFYARAANPAQGPRILRGAEHLGKQALFSCRDCGDCSLPEITFLCPESQCAKNQRNGPCGGTRDGKCEVEEFDCIWSRAYDRLKYEGKEKTLLDHAPVIQNQALRGTSSWANTYNGKDHHGSSTPL